MLHVWYLPSDWWRKLHFLGCREVHVWSITQLNTQLFQECPSRTDTTRWKSISFLTTQIIGLRTPGERNNYGKLHHYCFRYFEQILLLYILFETNVIWCIQQTILLEDLNEDLWFDHCISLLTRFLSETCKQTRRSYCCFMEDKSIILGNHVFDIDDKWDELKMCLNKNISLKILQNVSIDFHINIISSLTFYCHFISNQEMNATIS